ncbi:hypothetical protein BH11PAT1_BH11PAT1_2460 [soil metagenome]
MKLLTILIYDTNYVPGVPRVIPLLKIRAWQKNNCHITILCTKEGEAFYKREVQNVSFISINYVYKIKNAYSLPWEVTKVTISTLMRIKEIIGKFDVVYSQSAIIDFLFVPWVLKIIDKHIRWYVMVDNLVPPPSQRPGPFLKKFIPYVAFLAGNLLLQKADGLFVVTNFLKKYYGSRGYHVIKTADGYGIDVAIFTGKIPKDTPAFDAVYCGRLHAAKGVFDLIEVMKEVAKTRKYFILGILGDGEQSVKEQLQEKIFTYKLKKHISFTGYITGKSKGNILRNSGLFIFLSYDEGCPHAVIEAFANNKLVIAYDLPIYYQVFAKYIKSGQMILFKQGEFQKIALFINKETYKNNIFKNSLNDYTWDKITMNELIHMKVLNNS